MYGYDYDKEYGYVLYSAKEFCAKKNLPIATLHKMQLAIVKIIRLGKFFPELVEYLYNYSGEPISRFIREKDALITKKQMNDVLNVVYKIFKTEDEVELFKLFLNRHAHIYYSGWRILY